MCAFGAAFFHNSRLGCVGYMSISLGSQSLTGSWYAVRVRPKGEDRTSNELSVRGFESFLPMQRLQRRWSDRIKTIEAPVFPGYLFCRFEPRWRIGVLDTPGVIQIVG